jgi:predicted ATPase
LTPVGTRRDLGLPLDPVLKSRSGGPMHDDSLRRLYHELKRREVFRVAAAYAAAAFVILQATALAVEPLALPAATMPTLWFVVLGGFPIALGLAWLYELRIRRERREAGEGEGDGDDAGRAGSAPGERVGAKSAAARTVGGNDVGGNLPHPVSTFIGRDKELVDAVRILSSARLLTLTGPGGVGKTRLALKLAAVARDDYPDGAWLVELAPLGDPALVPEALAASLGVREERGLPAAEAVQRHLANQRVLIVLDNCEHLVTVCASLATALLRYCPDVTILATSREALGIEGEARYAVAPLGLPAPDEAYDPGYLAGFEAVRLFVDRARTAEPSFELTAGNASAVAQICVRLDGIPLALELAAARIRGLSADELAARLDDRFRILARGSRTALPRQQTLRALLDWSHDLLSPDEQRLFGHLSVFCCGFTLAAVEAVCGDDPIEPDGMLDLVTALVDKSIVVHEVDDAGSRFRMLDTIRQYAAERLEAAGRADALLDRHRDYYLALVESALPNLEGPNEVATLDLLAREHDNLRTAIARVLHQGDAERALAFAVPLARFWRVRGYLDEGSRQMAALLALDPAPAPSVPRATALHGAGWLARDRGEYAAARRHFTESLDMARSVGDRLCEAWSLVDLGFLDRYEGDYESARRRLEDAVGVARAADERVPLAAALGNLGLVERDLGRYDEAGALLEESLAMARTLGDRLGIAWPLSNLGLIATHHHDHAGARALLEEALTLWRALGDVQNTAYALSNLGHVATSQGDFQAASTQLEEALALLREVGDRRGIAFVLERMAMLAAERGEPELALAVAGHAAALRDALGAAQPPSVKAPYEARIAAARESIEDEAAAAAWARGEELDLDDVVDCITHGCLPGGQPAGAP